jgi:hypothetical protein
MVFLKEELYFFKNKIINDRKKLLSFQTELISGSVYIIILSRYEKKKRQIKQDWLKIAAKTAF